MDFDVNEYIKRSLGRKLGVSSRLFGNRMNRHFKENGLNVTPEQWRIFVNLRKDEGKTQNMIACATDKDEPSVSRLIDNMIKRNLVKRVPHPTDRRTNLIYLTEEGAQMQEDLINLALKTAAEATEGVNEQDLETCLRVLDKIIENLK
ncbi:MarR family winged helix-turn-helix transcriptional regulator [Brevibacillus migulae]|uniref:MarR family winged helix-turn-helix transcriptional regulator n=1 Tax=Brevibacillus migulae TaxID=1644114 RepID=UPI00106E0035|nr:MarR family winged helix-turn-helix transcriptional regulator [Brevibacillus migulae]